MRNEIEQKAVKQIDVVGPQIRGTLQEHFSDPAGALENSFESRALPVQHQVATRSTGEVRRRAGVELEAVNDALHREIIRESRTV